MRIATQHNTRAFKYPACYFQTHPHSDTKIQALNHSYNSTKKFPKSGHSVASYAVVQKCALQHNTTRAHSNIRLAISKHPSIPKLETKPSIIATILPKNFRNRANLRGVMGETDRGIRRALEHFAACASLSLVT